MDNTAPKLTLVDLIAFGRDYLQALEDPGKGGIHLSQEMLKEYLIRANEGLALLQREQAREKPRLTGGAPAGNGMGEQVMRLIANGMGEQHALRVVSEARRKPRANVLRAYNAARKKPLR